ncbi:MAG: THUMP domain-containing protein [Patescibacteria group bacterium]|nr:THUMP domain-containing protein [Patescibacteria group bacterium]
MDCFITCNSSVSEVGALDIKELINKDSEIFKGVCECKDVSPKDLADLSYRCQSAHRICIKLFNFEIKKEFNEDSFKKAVLNSINELNFDLFDKAKTFGVLSENHSNNDFLDSTSISRIVGGAIHDSLQAKKLNISVNLSKPDIPVFVYCNEDRCFVGIDLIGFDLMKRPYKLISQSSSLNGVFAYTIAKLAGVNKNSVVLDPFCGSGTIPIEIALYQQNHSCFHFEHKFSGLNNSLTREAFNSEENRLKKNKISKDKQINSFDTILKVITSAKKNSKIAGVLDAISLSKVDIEWIDAKFKEAELDLIITNPPKENVNNEKKNDVKKIYDELFYQSRFVLKDEGTLGILTNRTKTLLALAERHGFSLKKNIELYSGGQAYILLLFTPPSRKNED